MTKRRRKPTLRLTITAALALMTGLTAAAIAGLSYRSARRNLLDTYRIVLAQVAERIGERAKSYLGPLKNTAAACARLVESGAVRVERLEDVEALFFAHMAEYHRIASLDFGDAEGNFVMVKRMPDDSLTTKTLHRKGDQVRSEWKSRRPGATLAETSGVRLELDDAYDPRVRPWFVGARGAAGIHWTDVYALATDRKPAISASIAVQGAGVRTAVMSASMTLDEIDRFLSSIQIGRRGKAFVVDSAGRLLGHPAGVPLRGAADGSLSLPPLSACGDAALEALARAAEFRDALRAGEATELFRFEVEGEAYLATLVPLAYTLGRGWFVGAVVSEDDLLGPVRTELVRNLALSGGVSLCAFFVALALGRAIARPLHRVAEEAALIRQLAFSERALEESRFAEVSEILQAFSGMKVGLRAFEKYVPTRLVRLLLESGAEPRLGGRSEELTIFFSDIRAFSSLAEGMRPEELAERLGLYLGTLADTVAEAQGTVDKYIGDAVMAFWNAPRPVEDHAYHAVVTALRCLERVRAFDPQDCFHTRIGIHTADVLVGNFGSADRLSYTIVGDGVNLASRLEGVNKQYDTQILISGETYERIAGRIECRLIDRIAVKGRSRPTTLYEPLGEVGRVDAGRLARARIYERGLEAYVGRRFEAALELFDQVLAEEPTNGAAVTLRRRAAAFREHPPEPGWNGVFALSEK